MKLVVARPGRPDLEVTVERAGTGWRVTLGGRVLEVDARRTAAGAYSLLVDGAQREVAVEPLEAPAGMGRYRVTAAGGGPVAVEVLDPLTHLARRARATASGPSGGQVTAYMPGRVVAVLAAEGDEVAAGQGIVVLEAMKMENEIRAEHAGTLRRLLVTVGQPVEGGDPLFEVG